MSDQIIFETVALAAAGGVLGPAVAVLSAKRSAAQPLELALTEERLIISEVLARPEMYPVVAELESEHFADKGMGRIWKQIAKRGDEATDKARPETEAEVRELADRFSEQTLAGLEQELELRDRESLVELQEKGSSDISIKELVKAGAKVLGAYDDRTRLAGAVAPSEGEEDEAPFVRKQGMVGARRKIMTAALLAITLGFIPYFVWHLSLPNHFAVAAAATALIVLAFTTVEIAVVDFDTFYVDYPVLAVGGGVGWLGCILTGILGHRPHFLLAGLIALVCLLFFEMINFVYSRVRHRHGMGFGDSVLLLVAIGIPAAMTGSERLGWDVMIISLLLAIGGFFVQLARRRAELAAPFALGPYMALGWVVAWALSVRWPNF